MTAVPDAMGGFSDDAPGLFERLAPAVAPAPAADPSHVIARLNSLLRGEISAAETYRSVLERMDAAGHTAHVPALLEMQTEHGRSCQLLRGRIDDLGGMPADNSGVWGIWVQTVQTTLSLLAGDAGGLRALREGEEHGQRDYETALNEVDAVTAQLIQDRLLPAQQKHLSALDRMLAAPTD